MTHNNKLPKDWKWVSLSKVAKFHQGYGFPKDLQGNKVGEYPFYKVGDISKNVKAGNRLLELCDNFIDENILLKLKAKPYPINTIVFAKIGEGLKLNRRAIVKKPSIVDNNAMGLKAIDNLCEDLFLYHFFNTVKLEDYSKATTVPSVRKSEIEEIQFPLPPLETQQAIVSKIEELFSELDKGIEDLKTAQLQLKTYRQSVLKYAFEGKLTNEKVKDGVLPKGWEKVTIGDVCYNVEYGSGTKSKKEGKVPVLRMGNIQNGIFDWNDLVYSDDDLEIKKYLLKKNDVLFNRTNSAELVGKTAIYKGERPAIFAGYLIRINRIEELIDAAFITYYLNSKEAKKYGNSVRSFGVNQSNINGTKLKTYPLLLPPLKEQNRIVQEIESRLSVADKMEESITQSLLQAEALRQSILKKAFSGELI
ncbi:restriction endonuclease subunit S [Flavobacterium taihuense]|uniref:Restriction endonuclease subunit S n=1 Tax=Flavobacterium taihuense TaxID=2857508 RepID=A0ABS6XWJ9_9FLAO|nr:restriction endonuclease subunit S [Flavobacterium taihuense]MBW4361056.1 restriction endonuclease subunit S [Flavobacterium taihuense]